ADPSLPGVPIEPHPVPGAGLASEVAGPPDAYEASYMEGGRSLARTREGIPWWSHALIGGTAASVVGVAVSYGVLGALPLLPLPVMAWAMFMYLRVSVTADHVHIQLGLFGPKIPLEAIEHCSAEHDSPLRYGGWGVRFAKDGTVAYSMPGD